MSYQGALADEACFVVAQAVERVNASDRQT
jgi:hypothetical protein